ncbi:hypothetical protein DFH09DRAFT_1099499 [Mycena vulgaris]|nr:hypothetical protein DFH09DRAFT_1099499 [Mycena vulgaris]
MENMNYTTPCSTYARPALPLPHVGLFAVPVTGTAVVLTGPERERSVTRRPSFHLFKFTNCVFGLPLHRTCLTKGVHGIFNHLWRVFMTRRPVDGRFRRERPSTMQTKSPRNGTACPSTDPVEPAQRARRAALASRDQYIEGEPLRDEPKGDPDDEGRNFRKGEHCDGGDAPGINNPEIGSNCGGFYGDVIAEPLGLATQKNCGATREPSVSSSPGYMGGEDKGNLISAVR